MSDIAIKVENLSKRYRIGLKEEMHDTLFGAITSWIKSPISNLRELKKLTKFDDTDRQVYPVESESHSTGAHFIGANNSSQSDVIWALKDVSFEVKHGEVLGIIGRNGAGKSTLLKILSRITEPTSGKVTINGRVSSLLEVGTGFHPELTGRENIYLNGTVLGMSKAEIDGKFDEIVAFAETGKFLDTPVKRYSSGMKVRLAFAVAAHLEPEILMIDEVLAVGDIDFQNKCLGKMGEVAKGGRTVLFVSHNMGAIRRLCPRTIHIVNGTIVEDGTSDEVVHSYIFNNQKQEDGISIKSFNKEDAAGNEDVRLMQIEMLESSGNSRYSFQMNEEITIKITYEVLNSISNFHLYLRLFAEDGTLAFCSGDWDEHEISNIKRHPGIYRQKATIPPNLLNSGKYFFTVIGMVPERGINFLEDSVISLHVNDVGGIGGVHSVQRRGIFRPLLKWRDSDD